MATNRGKDFECVIRDAFSRVDNTSVVRLPDPTNGYLGIRNISDFIVYNYPYQYFIECKSVHGNTLNIHTNNPRNKYGNISNNQWDGMLEVSKIHGVVAGVICWWVDFDVTKFIPILSLQDMRDEGLKSIRYDDTEHYMIPITGVKKRIFFDYDMNTFFKTIKKEFFM